MKRIAMLCTAAALGVTLSAGALAQAKPERLVDQRQAGMNLIGWYFGPIGAMVQDKMPYDANVVKRNAGYLATLSMMPIEGFQASTKDVKSDAKPEVWSDHDTFKSRMKDMQDAIAKLNTVAQAGADKDAVKAAFGGAGKACKACHDDFRVKK
ncbi:MAG TPA: cytochrome c [Burkholderiales bacterium]